jgi:hypothetical protein
MQYTLEWVHGRKIKHFIIFNTVYLIYLEHAVHWNFINPDTIHTPLDSITIKFSLYIINKQISHITTMYSIM